MTKDAFTVVGTVRNPDGELKVRWANDLVSRIKILIKGGCTEIDLRELPHPMTKLESLRYLESLQLPGDAGYVVTAKLAEKMKEAKKAQLKATGLATKLSEKSPELQASE
jgi:hypothetical protein